MTAIFIVIISLSAAAGFYSTASLLRHRYFSWGSTLFWALLCALLSGLHQFLLVWGNTHELGALRYLIYLTGFAAAFSILALPPLLIIDIILGVLRLRKGRGFLSHPGMIKKRRRLGSILTAVFACFALLAEYQAVRAPQVLQREIFITDLHPDLEGMTIVQITDVHASTFFTASRSQQMVEALAEYSPDLIVFTGDQVDGTPEMREGDLQPFQALQSRLGIFFIPGNHEYITGMGPWQEWYRQRQLNLLLNQHVTLQRGQAVINVIGLDDDQAVRRGEPGFTGPDIDKAVQGMPQADFNLLLAHQPRQAERYSNPALGIDLMLCGHTHGGQIPILRALTALANKGFVAGLYQVNGMQLYVSEGAGLWQGFPARLDTRGEIIIFTLRGSRP